MFLFVIFCNSEFFLISRNTVITGGASGKIKGGRKERVMKRQDLEPRVAHLNQNFFFREFSFSQTTFKPVDGDELELADHVVWLDNLLLSFQLKQRMGEEATAETETKWFRSKVINKAKSQVKDTHRYLAAHAPIQVTNERGHTFSLDASRIQRWHDVILYEPHPLLPADLLNTKSVLSSEVGLIHVFTLDSYHKVAQILFTPAEIADYLDYRRDLLSRAFEQIKELPEDALLGHYLYGDTQSVPHSDATRWVENLDKESFSFDLSPMLHRFAEKIVPSEPWGLPPTSSTDYYPILQELALLNRSELRWFKERRDMVLDWCRKDRVEWPTRMVSPRTGCGFILIPIPAEDRANLGKALQTFTYAHKYDQRLTKCIGMAVCKDGSYWDMGWCFWEEEWIHDPHMDKMLKSNPPLHPVRHQQTATYRFLSDH
jgi:hypothetical protein